MNKLFKQWAEKLSNFKLLARIMICLSAFVGVVAILSFIAFQFSRGIDPTTKANVCAFGAQGEERQLIGMGFFFVLTVALVLAIVVGYQSMAFAFPKTKMSPNKALPVISVVNGAVCVVAAIFCILAVVLDAPIAGKTPDGIGATQIAWAWYGLCVLFALGGLANLCMLLPALKSRYFMPKLDEENK